MAELKTVHLDLPASTADLRKLELGSVVYLKGRLFTAREGVYKRAIEDGVGMPADKNALGNVNFHCSPAASINPDGSYAVGAVTATASFRFAKWLDGWFKLSGCNIIIGKGGMTGESYRKHFVPNEPIAKLKPMTPLKPRNPRSERKLTFVRRIQGLKMRFLGRGFLRREA